MGSKSDGWLKYVHLWQQQQQHELVEAWVGLPAAAALHPKALGCLLFLYLFYSRLGWRPHTENVVYETGIRKTL